jgi:hypothetical protein
MSQAVSALDSGDVSSLLSLGASNSSKVDAMRTEFQEFAAQTKSRTLLDKISLHYGDILEFELQDQDAERVFEDSKAQAVAAVEDDLRVLYRLESLIDRAEASTP